MANMTVADDPKVAETFLHQGEIVGGINRFELRPLTVSVHSSGDRLVASQQLGPKPIGHFTMRWNYIPDDFAAAPGRTPPPVPFDPARPLRFMGQCDLRFLDREQSQLRLFGTGRTTLLEYGNHWLMMYDSGMTLLSSTGQFKGRSTLVTLNGFHQPPLAISATILVRTQGPLSMTSNDAPIGPSTDLGFPITTTMTFLGEEDPGEPTQRVFSVDGRLVGAKLRQDLHPMRPGATSSFQGNDSKQRLAPKIGRLTVDLTFETFSKPTIPLSGRDLKLNCIDPVGHPLGEIHVDMPEFPPSPLQVPTVGAQTLLGTLEGPVVQGTGIFAGVQGLVTVAVWIQLEPWKVSTYVVLRLVDPDGRFRAQAPRTLPATPAFPHGVS